MSKARNNVKKTNDIIDVVADYGADKSGVTDSTAAIQLAITENPAAVIKFPSGSYKVVGQITIASHGTRLRGEGGTGMWEQSPCELVQYTPDVDTLLFADPDALVDGSTLNNVGVSGLFVRLASSAYTAQTTGAGIRMRQCRDYSLDNFGIRDSAQGLVIEGGQDGRLSSFNLQSFNGAALLSEGAAQLHVKRHAWSGGSQECFTLEVSNFSIAGGLVRHAAVHISSADGLHFNNCHIGSGDTDLVRIKGLVTGAYINNVGFHNCYFDQVNASWSDFGVEIPDDAFGSGVTVHDISFDGCTFNGASGNSGNPLKVRKVNLHVVSVIGCKFSNSTTVEAIDFESTNGSLTAIGNLFYNCGNLSGTKADVRAGAGHTLVYEGNTHRTSLYGALTLAGNWTAGAITGNSSAVGAGIIDIANSATFASDLVIAGNVSSFTGAVANSWRGLNQATGKTTPVDADEIPLADSAATFKAKKFTWANLKATLKTYFDTLYQPLLATLTSWGAVTRATGFDAFAATPSSANLAALLTDELGAGNLPFTALSAWTPVLTCATPGDLNVVYSTQSGYRVRIGNCVVAFFNIVTSTFTWTTASGNMRITGVGLSADANVASYFGTFGDFRGITKASYTQFAPIVSSGGSIIEMRGSGSGQAPANLTPTDFPTGGTVILRGFVVFNV